MHTRNKVGSNTWFSRSNLNTSRQLDYVFGTSHFIAQARTLVPSPDRKALWEQSDHAPVLAKCTLLLDNGEGVSGNWGLEKNKWTSLDRELQH